MEVSHKRTEKKSIFSQLKPSQRFNTVTTIAGFLILFLFHRYNLYAYRGIVFLFAIIMGGVNVILYFKEKNETTEMKILSFITLLIFISAIYGGVVGILSFWK